MKQTKEGFFVIDDDTHISRWVEESGRLDHDRYILDQIEPLIPVGGVVVDVGAFIGDHTIAYARRVGDSGTVLAFEPNPKAFECLSANANAHFPDVVCSRRGLSDEKGTFDLSVDVNAGASRLVDAHSDLEIRVQTIKFDDFLSEPGMRLHRLDFMKIDAEGFELKILRGAANALHTYRPKLLVEINTARLAENGANVFDILSFVKETMGDCTHAIIPPTCTYSDAQYDLLIEPKY